MRSFDVLAFVFLAPLCVRCVFRSQEAAGYILVGWHACAEEREEVDWRYQAWSLGDVPRIVSCVVVWLTFI